MTVQAINTIDIDAIVHSFCGDTEVFETSSQKMDVLSKIKDLGTGYIHEIEVADEFVNEILDNFDDLLKQMNDAGQNLQTLTDDKKDNDSNIELTNKRITELTNKQENGEELTEEEQNELAELYAKRDSYQSTSIDKKIQQEQNKSDKLGNSMLSINEDLEITACNMEKYAETGPQINNWANFFGFKNTARIALNLNQRNSSYDKFAGNPSHNYSLIDENEGLSMLADFIDKHPNKHAKLTTEVKTLGSNITTSGNNVAAKARSAKK